MKKIAENDEMITQAERDQQFEEDRVVRREALHREMEIRDRGQMIRDAREEGFAQGFEEGRQMLPRQVAARLIARGDDDDEAISSLTGLTAEEVRTLRRQVNT